jgi:hypothetical protein
VAAREKGSPKIPRKRRSRGLRAARSDRTERPLGFGRTLLGTLTAGESNGNAQVKVAADRSDVSRMGQEPRPEVGRAARSEREQPALYALYAQRCAASREVMYSLARSTQARNQTRHSESRNAHTSLLREGMQRSSSRSSDHADPRLTQTRQAASVQRLQGDLRLGQLAHAACCELARSGRGLGTHPPEERVPSHGTQTVPSMCI